MASLSGYGSMTATSNLCLSPPGGPFNGSIDEIRVYSTVLSPEWLEAAWWNLKNRSAMISIGAEQ
jgi:hypothetical protein